MLGPFPEISTPPPVNTYLADSHWPMSHCNTYAQASTEQPGPVAEDILAKNFTNGAPGMITMAVSGPYSDGSRVIWGGNISNIVKMTDTGSGYEVIDEYEKEALDLDNLAPSALISGAYTLIDLNNEFYIPDGSGLNVYGDMVPDDPYSEIQLLRTYEIPIELLTTPDDNIVGFNITYDGYLVFVTGNGLVGLLDRSFGMAHYYQFGEDETISNSIAIDEEGGIYIVTSKKMYRVQWTGSELSIDESDGGWIADYETGDGASGIRLGDGSGSTPSLMGVGNEDKFVVITDGQDLMHLVLMWRGEIPGDWKQIDGTKSRRIAAQVPVTFGDTDADLSLSEQSVCVNGYGALVVNNLLASSTGNFILDILTSGFSVNTAWVNMSISYPNGIPCMSSSTGLIYNIGQNSGVWNFSALDWKTGSLEFRHVLGHKLRYNSGYAATEIGLFNGLYCGTVAGNVGVWQE